jgi:PAS domain-containing protein
MADDSAASQGARTMSEQFCRANEESALSEERFRDLFDEAPIAYMLQGLDSRIIQANRTAMRMLGIKPEETPGFYGTVSMPFDLAAKVVYPLVRKPWQIVTDCDWLSETSVPKSNLFDFWGICDKQRSRARLGACPHRTRWNDCAV